MAEWQEVLDKLKQELNPKFVKEREGGFGKKLSYIAGWVAEQQMNEVFDHKWSRETLEMEKLTERFYIKDDGAKKTDMFKVYYRAKVRVCVPDYGIVKEGNGFGSGVSKVAQDDQAFELAIKEAETDAFKRAVKSFGQRFGIKLYDADIDIFKEYMLGVRSNEVYRDAENEILNAKTQDEVGEIYKSYTGAYKTELAKVAVNKKRELK